MLSVIPAAESKCVCAGKFVWCVCVHVSGCASLCVCVCVCVCVCEWVGGRAASDIATREIVL